MAYKPAFHAYSAILNSFVYAYSAFAESFVIAFFLLRNTTFRSTIVDYNKIRLCLFKPIFWSRWLRF